MVAGNLAAGVRAPGARGNIKAMPTRLLSRRGVMLCLAAAAIASFTSSAASQRPDTVAKAGAKVRMWSARMHWSGQDGTVISWIRTDTVIVSARIVFQGKARTNRYQIPAWELDTLLMQVNAPEAGRRFKGSLVWGGIVGAAIGILTGYVSMTADECGNAKVGACTTSELATGSGFFGLIGGLLGLIGGALWNLYTSPADVGAWVNVRVPRPAG
jgi:hypothetical protein